ncbi:hypothetical protein [Alteribacillus sp. YIM 98480]|uniref:hypothetical protein n=1 Tax=Alteribacillus sp. YIM 98480 TaxID=2606599 RepID=UPI00131B2341|nr:hypothetical protein [Alteribacillus sp. YIM 98480]
MSKHLIEITTYGNFAKAEVYKNEKNIESAGDKLVLTQEAAKMLSNKLDIALLECSNGLCSCHKY